VGQVRSFAVEEWLIQEIGWFAVIMILGPYVIGVPIAILWVSVALLVERLTGWNGVEKEKVTPSCGCVFCDIGLVPIYGRTGYVHYAPIGQQLVECTNPKNPPK
jgi:hypothetical protein